MLPLLVVEGAFQQKRIHAHNQIHGRSDLMTDTGQKLALCPAGDFCRFFGEHKGLLSLPALTRFQCKGHKGGQ